MRAVILAAGVGRRLRPETIQTPKCLIEIGGKSIISHQLEALEGEGIKSVVVVVGYKAEQIMKHVVTNFPGIDFIFIYNSKYRNTGAAYSLWLARNNLSDDFIYLNADALFHQKILSDIISSEKVNLLAVEKNKNEDDEEVKVIIDGKGLIKQIGKKLDAEKSIGEFTGIVKLSKESLKKIILSLDLFVKQNEVNKYFVDAIDHSIKKHNLNIYTYANCSLPSIEIDFPGDRIRAEGVIRSWGNKE